MRRETQAQLRRMSIVNIVIVITLAVAAGRIAVVVSSTGDTAFLSANDRSRWATIAALVEDGTYAIDRQVAIVNPIHRHRRPWDSIDKVRHADADGVQHFYSSKPPLFPTLVAGVYKLLHLSTGLTMTDHPIYVPRIILAVVNLPLLAMLLFSVGYVLDKLCQSQWSQIFGIAGIACGTMLLPFTVSLNNHLPAAAAMAVVMAIYFFIAERIADADFGGSHRIGSWLYGLAGIAAAGGAANELPALSMTALWTVLFVMLERKSLIPFLGGMAIVAIGFFGTNYVAHGSIRPAYAHRGVGDVIATLDSAGPLGNSAAIAEATEILKQFQTRASDEIQHAPSDEAGRWRFTVGQRQYALVTESSEDGTDTLTLRNWDDWYEYPGSYWQDGRRRGVDRGEPSRMTYLFHMTLGHYGIFSLTPIWLMLPFGFAVSLRSGPSEFRWFAAAVLTSTLACLFFYVSRPMIDRNYGGVSTCFRWLLWMAPMWWAMILPILDEWSESNRLRWTASGLLSISVFSMSTALSSPWQSPWLYRFWQFLGWIDV